MTRGRANDLETNRNQGKQAGNHDHHLLNGPGADL